MKSKQGCQGPPDWVKTPLAQAEGGAARISRDEYSVFVMRSSYRSTSHTGQGAGSAGSRVVPSPNYGSLDDEFLSSKH
eukprot:1158669-Pelagomonas_calceolata.AAC.5